MATKTKQAFTSEVRAESFKASKDRRAIVQGRKGKQKPRRHALKDSRIRELRTEAGDSFPNPYQVGGVYHSLVQAAANLGVNKGHSFTALKAEMEKVMSKVDRGDQSAWANFANRKPRNTETGKDLNGRIHQTAQVLQRLTGAHPYGFKLRQVRACIDILADKGGNPLYMLNTSFSKPERVKPRNDLKGKRKPKAPKTQSTGKPKAKAKAKAPAKPKAKVTKPRSKTKAKAKAKVTKPKAKVPAKAKAKATPEAKVTPETTVE